MIPDGERARRRARSGGINAKAAVAGILPPARASRLTGTHLEQLRVSDLKRLTWRERVLLTLALVAAIALSLGRVPEVGTQPIGAASDARSQGRGSLIDEPTWKSPSVVDRGAASDSSPFSEIVKRLTFQAR
jgi:hypothetical protein